MTFHVNWQTIHMKCQLIFFEKKIKMSSAVVMIDVLGVKGLIRTPKGLASLSIKAV